MVKFKKNKKAFAFSFLALFLSFLIFASSSLYMFQGDTTKGDKFKDSRLSFVNNEILYFKNSYVRNIIKFSFYNTVNALLINKSNLILINKNYTKLNNLIFEGMTNGSFNGVYQPFLENKTVNFFISSYKDYFNKNYKGNLTYDLISLNIFEETPYYISLQTNSKFNITTKDNFSSWSFEDSFTLSVPVYNLKDPKYYILDNLNISINPIELYASNLNWTLTLLNDSLNKNLSTIYFEPITKYTIGNSFLSNLLNISRSSYKDILGFLSFDYDSDMDLVYDTSNNLKNIKLFANTRLLMNFENTSIFQNNISDLSSYNNSGILMNGLNCIIFGVQGKGCSFDGINDYINISKDKLNLNNTNLFSISVWVNPNRFNDSITGKSSEIFRYGSGTLDVLDLRTSNNGSIMMQIGSHNGGSFKNFNSTSNISLNSWSHLVGTFDGNSGIGKIYINGILDSESNSSSIINFKKSIIDIGIGDILTDFSESFSGSIDELGIYSKVLSENEVSILYNSKKAKFIEYKNSLQGKAIEFDGIDDYMNLSNNLPINNFYGNWSIGTWFKSYNLTGLHYLVVKHHPFLIQTDFSRIKIGVYTSTGWNFISGGDLIENNNYYVVSSWNSSSKILSLYLNGKLINQSLPLTPITSVTNNPVYIGVNKYLGIGLELFFKGLIDEVKIYNRTLDEKEVLENYYNYKSSAKGCCNYLNLINSNSLGYNTTLYNKNISYSTKTFYDYYKRSKPLYNVTLYTITNLTSDITSKNIYNFQVDDCILQAYSILSYGIDSAKLVKFGQYQNTCVNLIKAGIY